MTTTSKDLEPTARHLLHNISKYVHIELIGTTIGLNYTEESVRRLASELAEISNKGYDLAILENTRYANRV